MEGPRRWRRWQQRAPVEVLPRHLALLLRALCGWFARRLLWWLLWWLPLWLLLLLLVCCLLPVVGGLIHQHCRGRLRLARPIRAVGKPFHPAGAHC